MALLLALAGPLSTTLVAQLTFIARPRAERRVMIHVASRDELSLSYANELRKIVRDVMDDAELPVNVVAVRGLWRSDSDSPKNGSP